MKKTILIDLDGVLNNYSGNYDKDYIPEIKDGAREFIKQLSNEFDIKLFTTRNKNHAQMWLNENALNKYFSDITNKKDLAWLYIDDRCINFTGTYTGLYEEIKNFKPWYKN